MSEQKSRPAKRVSNACIPCRSRHMRCDSATPVCSRCQAEGSRCVYIKSRRGGVRRSPGQTVPVPGAVPGPSHPQSQHQPHPHPQAQPQQNPQQQLHHSLQLRLPTGTTTPTSLSSHSSLNRETQTQAPTYPNIQPHPHSLYEESTADATDNELLSLYFTYFHGAHPCVLPQWSLRLRAALQPESLELLMPVLQYIGSLYTPSIDSASLETKILDTLSSLRCSGNSFSPFDIQALLLYAVVVYWNDEISRSLDLLDEVIANAVKIGMNRAGFDSSHGEGDPILEESWRRTWWVLYLTATHVAGSTHSFPSKVDGIFVSVRLPCEEEVYEAGNIPTPPSIPDYESREFHPNSTSFSSFAELIGIARSLDFVLSERWQTGTEAANRVCANADTTILAWLLLLPPQKHSLVRGDGSVDQLLFRAHMLVYTYIVDLNRELSSLLHTSIESISRRTPRAPPLSRDLSWSSSTTPGPSSSSTANPWSSHSSQPGPTAIHLHTTKVLTAIEKMNALLTLTLPTTQLATHSPFIICMIANTAIAHLSAYKWVYAGPRLSIERERIRLVVAVLKRISDIWPLGRRTYREVVVVARDILGGADGGSNGDGNNGNGSGNGLGGFEGLGIDVDVGEFMHEGFDVGTAEEGGGEGDSGEGSRSR
ncbi:hypothetical protein BJX68DRAFT_273386 [Aspergillus pseudodeflectus]|uniref:Zn(2)-C6 fungal-type domain-containing protein n=1 Tax=Aspergillus pseudodeflectus TaxID=176178 RepID=A0ABR4J9M4_9EURO